MTYVLFCDDCMVAYSITEATSRFCPKCEGWLEKKREDLVETLLYPSEEEKRKIAEYIVNNYENDRKETGDLELKILDEVDATTINGRYEILMLATLFSEHVMTEKRALGIWTNLITWFRKNELHYYDVFLEEGESAKLTTLLRKCGAPSNFLGQMNTTTRTLRKYEGDINGLLDETSWRKTIKRIMNNCEGINQKAFWIARIMKQKEAWDIPGQYCCVSDSHTKGFLLNTGFIKTEKDLFHNSEIIWKYFNKPFEKHWYDLPVFRFAQWNGCSNCSEKICDFTQLSSCHERV